MPGSHINTHILSQIPKVLCPWEIEIFVKLYIRHLLSASSWKCRGLFPRVAVPRTTGRLQETFHSATKGRWMTTLSYWDTRHKQETAAEWMKTGQVGYNHIYTPLPVLVYFYFYWVSCCSSKSKASLLFIFLGFSVYLHFFEVILIRVTKKYK